jgi:hypothetical protein
MWADEGQPSKEDQGDNKLQRSVSSDSNDSNASEPAAKRKSSDMTKVAEVEWARLFAKGRIIADW